MKGTLMPASLQALLCAALLACTLAAAPGEPTAPPEPGGSAAMPAQTPDASLMARAKSWFSELQTGKVDRSQLATAANGALTDQQLTQVRGMIGSLGAPTSFEQTQIMSQSGYTYAVYRLTFTDGSKMDYYFGVDNQGKVAGLRLIPAQ